MAGRIEFVEPDPSTGPVPSAPAPRGRRRTVIAVVAVAAVLIGVLIGRGVDADHTGATAPATKPNTVDSVIGPQASALSTIMHTQTGSAVIGYCAGSSELPVVPGAVTVFTMVPAATGGERLEPARPGSTPCTSSAATCPGADAGRSECATTDVVSSTVIDSVSHRYPGAQLALASTETIRSTRALWYRLLVFALPHGRTLRVDVVRSGKSHARPGDSPGSAVARAVHTGGDLATVATIAGPGTARPDTVTLMRLTADPALSAVH